MFWNNNKNSPLYTIYKYNVQIYLNFWYSSIPGYSLKRVEKGIACIQAWPTSLSMEWPVLWLVFWFGFGFVLLNSEIIIPNWENNHNVKLSNTFHKNTAITWCDLHSISLNCQHLHLCMHIIFWSVDIW